MTEGEQILLPRSVFHSARQQLFNAASDGLGRTGNTVAPTWFAGVDSER